MLHPCEIIYNAASCGTEYGSVPGTCRVTGKGAIGLPFAGWVKDTFTGHSSLLPGDIISNPALFCFDEKSELIQRLTGRGKLQKFRTYSHFVIDGQWRIFTKADKAEMFAALTASQQPELAVMSDSGQKHLVFRHRPGFWQLEDEHIHPEPERLAFLHSTMQGLLLLGFTQKEIISGRYISYRIHKAGIKQWHELEKQAEASRGSGVFDVAAWLLYHPEK